MVIRMPKEINNETNVSKLELPQKPNATDWEKLITGLPTERVYLKDDRTVDETKAPHFAKWLKEDDFD